MIATMSAPLSANQIKNYHEKTLDRGDYYSQDGSTPGQWYGRAADMLGLSGKVDAEHLNRLADGQHPHTGEVLVASVMRDGEEIHRGGWDYTLSFDKSVSLQAQFDQRIVDLELKIGRELVSEMEKVAQIRTERGSSTENTRNLVTSIYRHDMARPDGGQLVPHDHIHVVVYNVSKGSDGMYRALQSHQLYKDQKVLSQMGTSKLEEGLHKLGYKTERDRDSGAVKILDAGEKGYSKENIEHFSPRRTHIKQIADDKGIADAANLTKLQRNTREWKQDVGVDQRASLAVAWKQDMQDRGIDGAGCRDRAIERGPIMISQEARAEVAKESVEYAMSHTTERASIAEHRHVITHALDRAQGRTYAEDIGREIERQVQSGSILRASHHQLPYLTTSEMMRMEVKNIDIMKEGLGNGIKFDVSQLNAFVGRYQTPEGHKLTDEQAVAIKTLLTRGDLHQGLEGVAGSSKTTLVAAMSDFLKEQGVEVRAFGPTGESTEALRKAGIENAQTAQKAINEPVRMPSGKLVVHINDESSQWSTAMVNAQMVREQAAKVGLTVWLGDQKQSGAVEAGTPIRQLQQAGMNSANLREIYRQKEPHFKAVAKDLSEGRIKDAFSKLDQVPDGAGGFTSHIHANLGLDGIAYKKAAELYMSGENKYGSAMVYTSTHRDRNGVNHEVRQAKIDAGQVSQEGYKTLIAGRVDMTKAERKWAGSYEPGLHVRIESRSEQYGIEKGALYEVLKVDAIKNKVTGINIKTGVEKTWTPSRMTAVSVSKPEERTFAIGDRIATMAKIDQCNMPNGQMWTIKALDTLTGAAIIQRDDGAVKELKLDGQPIDYGYAATTQHAQGSKTAVAITLNPINREAGYVGPTRAVREMHIVSLSPKQVLIESASRIQDRSSAIDGVARYQQEVLKEQATRQETTQYRGQAVAAVKAYSEEQVQKQEVRTQSIGKHHVNQPRQSQGRGIG